MRAERIATLLPEIVQRAAPAGSVIDGLLQVMAEQHRPVEDLLADFGRYVDPYRCPADFVPLLARWVGLDWLVDRPVGTATGRAATDQAATDRAATDRTRPQVAESAMRHLVFHAADLAKQRGTALGLRRTLELATGSTAFEVQPLAHPGFEVAVRGPEPARRSAALVCHIVGHEKPAFTTARIGFGDDDPVPLPRLMTELATTPPLPPETPDDQEGAPP